MDDGMTVNSRETPSPQETSEMFARQQPALAPGCHSERPATLQVHRLPPR